MKYDTDRLSKFVGETIPPMYSGLNVRVLKKVIKKVEELGYKVDFEKKKYHPFIVFIYKTGYSARGIEWNRFDATYNAIIALLDKLDRDKTYKESKLENYH